MSTENLDTLTPAADFMDSDDLADLLAEAVDLANEHSDDLGHWLQTDDGHAIYGIRIEKETDDEGKVSCNIVLVTTR